MTIIGLIGLFVIAFVVYLFVRDAFPAHMGKRFEDVYAMVDELYRRGYDNGFIVIKARGRSEFVQISKHIDKPGSIRMTMDFPVAEWSRSYYSAFKELLEHENVSFKEVPRSETLVYIIADFGPDSQKCAAIMKMVFESVFGIVVGRHRFNVSFDDVSPYDEHVGF